MSRAVTVSPGSLRPQALVKCECAMPSSAARLFIMPTKLSSDPPMPSARVMRRVVARLDDQPAQQILDADFALDAQEHRRSRAPCAPPVRQAYSETRNLSSRCSRPSFSSRNTISATSSLLVEAGGHRLLAGLVEQDGAGVVVFEPGEFGGGRHGFGRRRAARRRGKHLKPAPSAGTTTRATPTLTVKRGR